MILPALEIRPLLKQMVDELPRSRNRITSIPGIRLVEKRDPIMDSKLQFLCAQWAFGVYLREPWAKLGVPLSPDLWDNSFNYLSFRGYKLVDDAKKGDVVRYIYSCLPETMHYGIYWGNNKVRSKFGNTDIYEHGIAVLPDTYGNEALLYRKNK